jgi:hypothetical protein
MLLFPNLTPLTLVDLEKKDTEQNLSVLEEELKQQVRSAAQRDA